MYLVPITDIPNAMHAILVEFRRCGTICFAVSDYDLRALQALGIGFGRNGWSFQFEDWCERFLQARTTDEALAVVQDIILVFRVCEIRSDEGAYAYIQRLADCFKYMYYFSSSAQELTSRLVKVFSFWANNNYPFTQCKILLPLSPYRDGEPDHPDFTFSEILSILFDDRELRERIEPSQKRKR